MATDPTPLMTERQYQVIATTAHPLILESGRTLADAALCYETYGTLNETCTNAILICHALTGDSHAAGKYLDTDTKPGWWDLAIGPGKPIDTDQYFVICSNVLGGCQGSTGPSTVNPETGAPWALDFPVVTCRDMIKAQARLLDHLGIAQLVAVVGGSLGGMQTLEWAVTYPDRMRGIIPIGGAGRFHPQGIALNEVQRQAIMQDPNFQGGSYYGNATPDQGLALARMLGMITYRSDESMWQQFGRELRSPENELGPGFEVAYQVESYLHYQGNALVQRFDANSYLYLSRAMDLQDLGRGYHSYETAHARIRAKVLAIGISSDMLFLSYLQQETVDIVNRLGGNAQYLEMNSPWGHDAFLVDFHQIANPIYEFLTSLKDFNRV